MLCQISNLAARENLVIDQLLLSIRTIGALLGVGGAKTMPLLSI
jgi:hypothetical protein